MPQDNWVKTRSESFSWLLLGAYSVFNTVGKYKSIWSYSSSEAGKMHKPETIREQKDFVQ